MLQLYQCGELKFSVVWNSTVATCSQITEHNVLYIIHINLLSSRNSIGSVIGQA